MSEAREQAWMVHNDADAWAVQARQASFYAGWGAAKRDDQQRIVALVPTEATCFCDEAYTKRGLQDPACHYHDYDWLWDELRALGQSEEAPRG